MTGGGDRAGRGPHDQVLDKEFHHPALVDASVAQVGANLDFEALEASRAQAQVANDRDWYSQYFPSVSRARVEAFGGGAQSMGRKHA